MTRFSDFINYADDSEREQVYSHVMVMADLRQRISLHGCRKSDIANMDHYAGYEPDRYPIVSRMCMTCYRHWYGNAGVAVFEMPRDVWDGWINSMFDA